LHILACSVEFSSCVTMSLTSTGDLLVSGTQYLQQSYKVSESFPFKWINKKWKEGFFVTAMATAGSRWAIVMSRGAGFSDQVLLFSFLKMLY
jgi:hypothetical protein